MSIRKQLEASLMLHHLGAAIFAGEEAIAQFERELEELELERRADEMRAQNRIALERLDQLLRWLKAHKDDPQ